LNVKNEKLGGVYYDAPCSIMTKYKMFDKI